MFRYIVCQRQYAKNARMSYSGQIFVVCKPACFSGYFWPTILACNSTKCVAAAVRTKIYLEFSPSWWLTETLIILSEHLSWYKQINSNCLYYGKCVFAKSTILACLRTDLLQNMAALRFWECWE